MTEHDADSVSLPINDFKEIEQIELGADYVPARRDNPENAADDMTMTYMTAALLRLKRRWKNMQEWIDFSPDPAVFDRPVFVLRDSARAKVRPDWAPDGDARFDRYVTHFSFGLTSKFDLIDVMNEIEEIAGQMQDFCDRWWGWDVDGDEVSGAPEPEPEPAPAPVPSVKRQRAKRTGQLPLL